jgi:hypothetical protein
MKNNVVPVMISPQPLSQREKEMASFFSGKRVQWSDSRYLLIITFATQPYYLSAEKYNF